MKRRSGHGAQRDAGASWTVSASRFLWNMLAVAYKETALMRRDKVLLGALVAQPLMMLFLFGVALSNRPAHVPWGVIDRSHSSYSRRLVSEIQVSGYFVPVAAVRSYEEARERLHDGSLLAVVVIPQDFERKALTGDPGIQLLLDGTDALSSARIGAYIRAIAARLDFRHEPRPATGPPAQLSQRFWFNPTLSDRRFLLASLGGMLLTNVCLSISCLGLVLEREEGTYEQMLSLPTTTLELVMGKLLPSVGLCYMMLAFAVIAPGLIFGIWPEGNMLTLGVFTFPFIMATLSLGVVISLLVNTVAQAVFLSVFFIMPSFVLSGVMMPYQLMADGPRQVGAITPLRWYQIGERRIATRGGGFEDVLLPAFALTAIFVAMLLIVKLRSKPRLA